MHLHCLHITNIASIPSATIDFTRPPLADSDVFLITGKTGAGKTTLLDAICLALYAQTPRIASGANERIMANADNLTGRDPRQLLRQGTGYGGVTLTFQANDGNTYEASWYVERGRRRKAGGQLSRAIWTLQNLTTGQTLTDEQVAPAIQQAVGLSFNQFCRTTLLAQGDFTRFLYSTPAEKAEILEKVTGTSVYTRIGIAIYERTSSQARLCEEARARLDGIRPPTPDEAEALARRTADADAALQQLQQLQDRQRAARQWLLTRLQYEEQTARQAERLQAARAVLASADFARQVQLIAEWEQTADARRDQRDLDDTRAAAVTLDNRLADLHRQYAACQQAAQDRLALLQTLDAQQHDLARQRHSRQQDADQAAAQRDSLTQRLDQAERRLEAMQLPALHKQYNSLGESLNEARDLARRHTQLQQAHRQLLADQARLAHIASLIAARKDRRIKIAAYLAAARQLLDQLYRQRQQQAATVDTWARQIRTTMTPGCTCPVCQQELRQPLPAEALLDSLYHDACLRHDAQRRTVDRLQRLDSDLLGQIAAYTRQQTDQTAALDTRRSQWHTEADALAQALRPLGIAPDGDVPGALDARIRHLQASQDALTRHIAQAEAAQADVRQLRAAHTRQTRLCEAAQAALLQARDAEADALTRLTRTRQEAAHEGDVLSRIHALMDGGASSGPNGLSGPNGPTPQPLPVRERPTPQPLPVRERPTPQPLPVREGSIMQASTDVTPDNGSLSAPSLTGRAGGGSWRAGGGSSPDALHASLAALLAERRALHARRSQLRARIDAFLAASPHLSAARLAQLGALSTADILSARADIDRRRQEAAGAEAAYATLSRQLHDHIAQRPADLPLVPDTELPTQNADLDRAISRTDADLQVALAERDRLRQQMAEGDRLRNLHQAESQRLADLTRQHDAWKQLCDTFGDAKGTKFQTIAQSFILQGLLHSANSYLRTLHPRYSLRVVPGRLHIALDDAYQASSRPASTLSGGESFLVSLALALALADIGHNLAVDTLLIDEGFGTLSAGALTDAIATLRALHRHSRRHVGIISHVEELRENIPVQIRVDQQGMSSSSTVTVVP